jgi:hypothetical protein
MKSIFKPKYNFWGVISLILAGLIIFLALVLIGNLLYKTGLASHKLLTFLIVLSLIIWIFIAILYFTIRYELKDEYVKISFGLFAVKIPYREIFEIKILNLDSGGRLIFPGMAMGPIYYVNAGYVLMVGTRAEKEIFLIATEKGKLYGITPSEPEKLLDLLKERIPSEAKDKKSIDILSL